MTLVVAFFAAVYFLLAWQFDGIGTRLDALYFAMTTLGTVGFGDIVAVGQAARAVVTVQTAFDLLVVTTALSLVVGALRRRP
ncbi:potassium channel family protein [Actinomadura hibisca]|uniref:potassium channel family protein n=1 Tax=Actinomadura hibisca TaxID=68565 RepID=UPI000AF50DBD|nr:potassium channel family protein [Actinomadura hibisca]